MRYEAQELVADVRKLVRDKTETSAAEVDQVEDAIETLASCANMSASTFHEHFKRSTLLSPVQYLKRLRLLRAQQLLVGEGLGVAQVAHRVGYQSTSQFSREYKRYFERNPGDERAA